MKRAILLLVLAAAFVLAGCETLGLVDPKDGSRDFFDRLERQSGGA